MEESASTTATETPTAATIVQSVKAGYKTTEFWATVGVNLVIWLAHSPGQLGTVASAISVVGYAVARALTKR